MLRCERASCSMDVQSYTSSRAVLLLLGDIQKRYRNEVLDPHARLFWGAVSQSFIFMDDNARCHRVNLVEEFLQGEDIQRMEWPARSLDLNLIEHA